MPGGVLKYPRLVLLMVRGTHPFGRALSVVASDAIHRVEGAGRTPVWLSVECCGERCQEVWPDRRLWFAPSLSLSLSHTHTHTGSRVRGTHPFGRALSVVPSDARRCAPVAISTCEGPKSIIYWNPFSS